MARLPDIPESLWIEDQQNEFDKNTSGMWDATMFDEGAAAQEQQIPVHLGPTPEEVEAGQIAAERKQAADEQAAREAEGEKQYQAYLAAVQEHETQQQVAQQDAEQNGIRSPGGFAHDLMAADNRPTTGLTPDNTSSGAFNTIAPDTGTPSPPDPTQVTDLSSFNAYAGQMHDAIGQPDTTKNAQTDDGSYATSSSTDPSQGPPIPAGESVWDRASRIGQQLWGQAESAASDVTQNPSHLLASPALRGSNLVTHGQETVDDILSAYDADQKLVDARKAAGYDASQSWDTQTDPNKNQQNPDGSYGTGSLSSSDPGSPQPVLPEQQPAQEATKKAIDSATWAPIVAAQDIADLALADPNQQHSYNDPYGIMDAMGIRNGVTAGKVLANTLPIKLLEAPQLIAMAGQMIEDPVGTAGTLGFFHALGPALSSPLGRRLALALVGGLAGGIDAYVEKRDPTGTGAGSAENIGLEAAGGAVVGGTLKDTLPIVPRLIKAVAASPTARDALHSLDVLAGKGYDEIASRLRQKSPGIAEGILGDDSVVTGRAADSALPGWAQSPDEFQRASTARRLMTETKQNLGLHATIPGSIGATSGAVAGTIAGYDSADENAPMSEKLTRAGTGLLAGAIVGGSAGGYAGVASSLGAAKFIGSMVEKGQFSADLFDSHPDYNNRIAAVLLSVARDKGDNEIVADTPAAARLIQKLRDDLEPDAVINMPSPDSTAGEIRAFYKDYPLQSLGRAVRDVIVDHLTNSDYSQARRFESGADLAMTEPLRNPNLAGTHGIQSAPASRIRGFGGERVIEVPETSPTYQRVQAITDEMGLPKPRVLVANSTDINASATPSTGSKPVLILNHAVLDSDNLDDEEFRALLMHELAHATDADTGKGLLQNARDYLASIRRSVSPAAQLEQRGIVPTRVVDQMRDIPIKRDYAPDELKAIEAVGGRYHPDEGVTVGVTRAQTEDAAGGIASRGGPHYEPVAPGQRSGYYDPEASDHLGGDIELPRTTTRYRNPLILRQEEDTGNGLYDNGFKQLDIQNPDGGYYEAFDPVTGEVHNTFSTEHEVQDYIHDNPDLDYEKVQSGHLTRADLDEQLHNIRRDFPQGSEGRKQAIKDLIAKHGGDPRAVDHMFRIAGDAEESSYAVAENILAENARKQGHDAIFHMNPHVDTQAYREHPDSAALEREYKDAEKAYDLGMETLWDKYHRKHEISREEFDTQLAPLIERKNQADQARKALQQKFRGVKFDEIHAIREDRNPVPSPDTHIPEIYDRNFIPSDAVEQPVTGQRPGYSVHPDIALPEGTTRRTFDEPTIVRPTGRGEVGDAVVKDAEEKLAAAQAERVRVENEHLAYLDDTTRPDSEYEASYARANEARNKETYYNALVRDKKKDYPIGKVDITPAKYRDFPESGNLGESAAPQEPFPEIQHPFDPAEIPLTGPGAEEAAAFEMRSAAPRKPLPANLQSGFSDTQSPTPPRQITRGLYERAAEWWAMHATDNLAKLSGYMNDVAKQYERETGMQLPAEYMVAELKRLDPNKAAEVMIDTQFKPALRAFKELGLSNDVVDNYLRYRQYVDIARHQGNYATTGLMSNRTFPGNKKYPNGITAHQADAELRALDGWMRATWTRGERQKFDKATQQVWDLGHNTLSMLKDAGLITEQAFNDMRKAYPRYVPTKIVEYLANDSRTGVGSSLSITSNTIHALSHGGTEKESLSPLSALVGMVYESHAAARKNQIFNAFLGLWEESTRLGQQPAGVVDKATMRTRELAQLVTPWTASNSTGNTWVPVQGFYNGQKIKLAVHSDLGDVTKFDSPLIIPVISGLMQAFKSGLTSRSPAFLLSNAVLDWTNYMVRETARDVRNPNNPFSYINAAQRVHGSYMEAVAQAFLTLDGWKNIARHEYNAGEREFLSKGGGFSNFTPRSGFTPRSMFEETSNDRFEAWIAKALKAMGRKTLSPADEEVRRLQRGLIEVSSPADVAKTVARLTKDMLLLKPIEAIGEHIELAPRVAAMRNAQRRAQPGLDALSNEFWEAKAYEHAQQNGLPLPAMSPQWATRSGAPRRASADVMKAHDDARFRSDTESVNAGRTVTIDFSKGGTWSRNINQFVPFFNVGMQALADPVRAARENPQGFAGSLLTATIAPMMIAEAVNNRNPQTREDYDNVPQFLKDEGLVLMLPNEWDHPSLAAPVDENGNRHPQFLHIRYRQFAPLAALTRETLQHTLYRKEGQYERGIPYILAGMLDSINPVQASTTTDMVTSLTTPQVSTALQLAFNRDTFRDRAIVSAHADEQASPLSHALAKRFGVNDDTSRPSWWDFATRDTMGGYASMWHGASDILAGKKPRSLQDEPVAGGLISRFVKGSIGEDVNRAVKDLITPESHDILVKSGITWRPTPAQTTLFHTDLNQAQYAKYQTMYNEATNTAIHEATTDKDWNKSGQLPEERQKILQKYLDYYRKGAMYRYYGTLSKADVQNAQNIMETKTNKRREELVP